jgi:release factor glutamine methyltransferase
MAADGRPEQRQLWTPLALIKVCAEYLAEHHVPSPRLNAELLLSHVLGVPRLKLYLDFERPIVQGELDRYRDLVRQRGRRVPLQLLTGEAHLLDLTLTVRPGVFIPRPETETLIEVARGLFAADAPPRTIVEVGIGTGCIGIALLAHWPSARLTGFDLDGAAVELARANAQRLGVAERATFAAGDPLGEAAAGQSAGMDVTGDCDLLVSNPPYVRRADIAGLPPEVRDHDPHAALDGGLDGLEVIRRLVTWGARALRRGGWMVFEHGDEQANACAALLAAAGFAAVVDHHDLGGRPRVAVGRWA